MIWLLVAAVATVAWELAMGALYLNAGTTCAWRCEVAIWLTAVPFVVFPAVFGMLAPVRTTRRSIGVGIVTGGLGAVILALGALFEMRADDPDRWFMFWGFIVGSIPAVAVAAITSGWISKRRTS